ncbi:hypothetical protein IP81_08015 [Novosphingobium sp. AAP83]|nr:hypothetical protein IP81_08015 [Novosphingobium sp. AAP83]
MVYKKMSIMIFNENISKHLEGVKYMIIMKFIGFAKVHFSSFRFLRRVEKFAFLSILVQVGKARALYALCESLDLGYRQRRIAEETVGNHGLQDLQYPA